MRRTPSINPPQRSPSTVYLSTGSHERQPLLVNTIPPELRTSMFEYPSSYVRIVNDDYLSNNNSNNNNNNKNYNNNKNENVLNVETSASRKWWNKWLPKKHNNNINNINNNENSLWAEQVRVFDATGNLTFKQTGINAFRFRRLTPFYWLRAQSWKWLLSFSIALYLIILGVISIMYYFWARLCGAGNEKVNELHTGSSTVSWITSLYFTTVSLAANGGYAGEDEYKMMNPSHICYTGRTIIVMLCSYVNIIFVGLVAALVVSKATATTSLADRIVFSTYCTLSSVHSSQEKNCNPYHYYHTKKKNKNKKQSEAHNKKQTNRQVKDGKLKDENNNDNNNNNNNNNNKQMEKTKQQQQEREKQSKHQSHNTNNKKKKEWNQMEEDNEHQISSSEQEEEYEKEKQQQHKYYHHKQYNSDDNNDSNDDDDEDEYHYAERKSKRNCKAWKLTFRMANTENTKPLAHGNLRLFCVTAEPLKEYRKSQQRLQEYLRQRAQWQREREQKQRERLEKQQQELKRKSQKSKNKQQEEDEKKREQNEKDDEKGAEEESHNSFVSTALSKLIPSGFRDKDKGKDKEVSFVRSPHEAELNSHENGNNQNNKNNNNNNNKDMSTFAESEVHVANKRDEPHLLEQEQEEEQWQEEVLLQQKEQHQETKNKANVENVVNVITPYGPIDKVLSLSTTPSPIAEPATHSSLDILGASETTEEKLKRLVKSHNVPTTKEKTKFLEEEEEEKEEEQLKKKATENEDKLNRGERQKVARDKLHDEEIEMETRFTDDKRNKRTLHKKQSNNRKEESPEQKEEEEQEEQQNRHPYYANYGTHLSEEHYYPYLINSSNNSNNNNKQEEKTLADCTDIFCMERVRVKVSELKWRCAEESYLDHGKGSELSLWYPATIVHVIDEESPLYRFMEMSRNGVSLYSDFDSNSEDDNNNSEESDAEREHEREQNNDIDDDIDIDKEEEKDNNMKNSKAHKYSKQRATSRHHAHRHRDRTSKQNDSGSLLSRHFQIIAVFNATEMETGATIMATHSYITTDIIAHYKFSNKLVHMHPLGLDVYLDYHYFNALLPISAQESSTSDSSETSSVAESHEEHESELARRRKVK